MLRRLPLASLRDCKILPMGRVGSEFLDNCSVGLLEEARRGAKEGDQEFQGHLADGICVKTVCNVRRPAHGGGEGVRGVEAFACGWS